MLSRVQFYKRKEWYKVRAQALKRDQYRCRFCGCSVREKGQAHVDHIKRRTTHPHLALTLHNLQTLCSNCHNSVKKRDEANPNRGVNADGTPMSIDSAWYSR